MEIKESLNNISEDQLKDDIIIPLLHALGHTFVIDGHGGTEKGRDIIYQTESTFKTKIYGGIVLKNNGNIGKNNKLERIERQAKEALSKFKDPKNPTSEVRIHELIIMTSYEFTFPAYEYICEQIWANNFPNVHVIDGDMLQSLVEDLIVEYNKKNPMDVYVFSTDTFKNFCEKYSKTPITEMQIMEGSMNNLEGESI